MSEKKLINASTVARIAGNLLSGEGADWMPSQRRNGAIVAAVETARAIVAEVERTEPATERQDTP